MTRDPMTPVCRRRGLALAVLAAVLGLAGTASHATAVAGMGGGADPGRRPAADAPGGGSVAPGLDLVAARIDAVSADGRSITLRGKPVALHPSALRVVGPGGQVLPGASALRPGMRVRLAFEAEPRAAAPATPGAPAHPRPASGGSGATSSPSATPTERRIVLLYIDSLP
jgi:hypothetical protein